MWIAEVLTLYPQAFPGILGQSVVGRGLGKHWNLNICDLRDFGVGEHRSVDDEPYGGGSGMVLRVDVVAAALSHLKNCGENYGGEGYRRLYLSPRGRPVKQADIELWSREAGLILLCGRFGGVDQRIIDGCGFEEVSLCDFVLSGGEVAAMAVIEACVRLLPGVLGDSDSLKGESFGDGLLQHAQYTRPREWDGLEVPDILLGGNHGEIAKWRRQNSEEVTRRNRKDLWDKKKKD